MAKSKDTNEGGISALVRNAGREAKKAVETSFNIRSQDDKSGIFDILDYIEQPWGLNRNESSGTPLWPAQRFLVKLYYNIPLDDKQRIIEVRDMFGSQVRYRFTEVEYLRYLYSEQRCNISEQDRERRELVLAIGRRAGKTTLSSIFASYELYRILSLGNPQSYYGLPEGNRIQLISIATDKEQAGILFSEVTNHLTSCEYFKPYIANDTQQFVNIRTPHDIDRYGPTKRNDIGSSLAGKASLRLTFKGSNGKGLRGFGNIVVIMDEMAHFIEDGGASAKEVYDAVTPSTAAYSPKDHTGASRGDVESRVITISSPLNKAGKFYELYMQAMHGGDAAKNMLAVRAPTWEVNPTVPTSYYRQKFQQDPAVFMVEHGADFSDRVRGWIEREEYLMDCVDVEALPKERGVPRYPHQMGIDIGLVNDGTSIFITHVEGDEVILDYHELWEAGKDWHESNPHLEEPVVSYAKTLPNVERIEFEEIANWIEQLTKRFYITAGLFDRWNGIPLEQNLRKRGLTQFKSEFFTTDMSSRIYQTTKMLMIDRKLRVYNYVLPQKVEAGSDGLKKNSPFIAELLKLEAEQRSKNLVIVRAPALVGNHDDMSDAFVRSVWLSAEMLTNAKHMAGSRHRDPNVPRQASSGNAVIYQARRARTHGVFTDRMVPRGMKRGRGR